MLQKILLVEDNPVHMEALCKVIEDLHRDICVYCASDLESALKISLEQHIHVFLVDIVLNTKKCGDVSGLKFAREIRGILKYKFTPLIFITSLEDPKLFSYSQLHCFGYIEKPFAISQVRDTILAALEFPVKEDEDRHMYFRKDGLVYSKSVKDIVCMESTNRRVRVYCVDDIIDLPYKSSDELMRDIDSDSFVRCSRYAIVNKRYVDQIDYTNRYVKMKYMDEPIEIGIIVKKAFKEAMENE